VYERLKFSPSSLQNAFFSPKMGKNARNLELIAVQAFAGFCFCLTPGFLENRDFFASSGFH
jgi:hypothetical protein